MALGCLFVFSSAAVGKENDCQWFVFENGVEALLSYVKQRQRAELVFLRFKGRWTWILVGSQQRMWCFVQSLITFIDRSLRNVLLQDEFPTMFVWSVCYYLLFLFNLPWLLGSLLNFLPSSNWHGPVCTFMVTSQVLTLLFVKSVEMR